MPDESQEVTLDMSKSQSLTPAQPAGVKLDVSQSEPLAGVTLNLSKSKPLAQAQEENLRSTSPKASLIPPALKPPTLDMHYVSPITGEEQKPLPKNFTEVPSKALPSDETVGKVLAIPARMGAAGAKFGKKIGANIIPASDLLAEDISLGNGHPMTEEQSRAESPRLTGALEGMGETVGGAVADPTNWALAATGAEAGPVLGKLASAVFAAKMGKDTYQGTKQLIADWDTLTPEERSAEVTKLGINAIFAATAASHAASGLKVPESVKSTPKELISPDEATPSSRASDKSKVWPLIKREAAATLIPMNERFGINKPTVKEWRSAFTQGEIPTVESAQGTFHTDEEGNKTFLPFEAKFPDGATRWLGKEGEWHLSRRTGESPQATSEPLIPTQSEKPSPWATDEERTQQESSLPAKGNENLTAATVDQPLIPSSAKPGARYRGMEKIVEAPATTSVDTVGKGVSKSGTSPPAELIPTVRPSATRPASTEAITTSKAKPEDTLIPHREPGLLSNGEEGREPARTADDYHPAVRQKVYELSNADLDKLAKSHGIDPSDPQYSRSKEMRNEGRHQTGRQKLADDIAAAMGDDEKTNIGRNIEQSDRFSSKDTTSQSKAEKAAKNFPRLRGPVDEAGNPVGSLSSLSPKELHENLGFGERNTGVTKDEFEAAKKSFNDKATRSNAGIDPTMFADAYKIAAYYFEGGLREFSAFSKQMISKLGESIRPHLEEIYARAKAHVAPTWKGTAEEWTTARAQVDAATARAKNLPEGPRLPEALGGTRLPEEQPFQGQTLDPNDVRFKKAQIERYVDPKGQFYKTVLKELRKSVASDAASDLAQEVMLDYQQGVIDGRFEVPARPSDEGLVTNQLKAITKNKAADWADKASGVTASGTPRSVVDTKRMSEAKSGAEHIKEAHATDYEVGSSEDESVSKADRNSKSPYGFGEEPDHRNEHSNAQRALEEYLKQNPKTAEADRELLRNASEQSVAKSEAARSKAYDKELAKSGDVEKAIEVGRKAAALTNRNKYNATDRYFGLTDADMTKLGQSHGMTGTKFRARLTAVMDDLNRRATQGNERPRTGPPAYTGDNSYTNFLSGEGPTRPAYSRINVENTPTAGTSTGTSLDRSYGNAEGFISSQPKAGKPEEPDEFSGTREEAQEGTPRPLIEPAPLSKGGKAGIGKIDLEGAAANRERIANARVSEAQKSLSEATTPAAQRKARAELEDAKDRLNYLKALQQPISGGSQGAAVHQIASDYLKELQRGGAEIPKIELAVPEAGNIIHGVEEEAKRFGVNLRSRGFEQPTNVSHEGKAGSTLPRIAIGNPTEGTNLIPEADTSDLEKGAGSILAKREGDANRTARAPEEDRLDQLQTIRQRLGLKPSQSARIETVPGSLGNQTPLTSGPDVERLKTRSQAKYSYTEKPFGDSTKSQRWTVRARLSPWCLL